MWRSRISTPLDRAKKDALRRDWQALDGLPAVRGGRIYVIDRDDALIPGPRMAEVAGAIAAVLHGREPARSDLNP